MPKVVKVGKCNVLCWSQKEIDRWPNIALGRKCNVFTNNLLKKNPRLNQFINNETMGALDNYAEHEKIRIYITPLENDVFNDLKVSVYKNDSGSIHFPISTKESREGVTEFFRELYNNIHKAIHPSEEIKYAPKIKHTKSDDFKMYVENVKDRFSKLKFLLNNWLN